MAEKKSSKRVSPDRKRFADYLVERRISRGFPTAYGFFHKCGGARYFGFSYHHYLLIERGERLPSQASLKLILNAMGTGATLYEENRRLLTLFVKALLEGDPMFDPLFEKAGPGGAPERAPEDLLLSHVAEKAISAVPRFDEAQFAAMSASPEAYWTLQYLLQTGTMAAPGRIAEDAGIEVSRVIAALDSLQKVGLVEKRKDGLYLCPFFATDIFESSGMKARDRWPWFSKLIEDRVQKGAAPNAYSFFFLAFGESELKEKLGAIGKLLRESTRKAYLFRPGRPAERGSVVAVEARVTPVMKFGEPSG